MGRFNDWLRGTANSILRRLGLKKRRHKPSTPKLCKEMMCLGTPDEMAKIINAGYVGALKEVAVTMTEIDLEVGRITGGKEIWMAQIAIDRHTGCVLHKDGKCALRDAGLTPEIGRRHLKGKKIKNSADAYQKVFESWQNPENAQNILFCLSSVIMKRKIEENNPAN